MCLSSKHVTLTFLAIAFLIVASLACAGPTAPTTGGGQGQPTQPPAGPGAKATPPASAPGGNQLPISPELKACLDSVAVYANAKENPDAEMISRGLSGGKSGMRAYVTNDPTEKVIEFYKANPPNPSCTVIPIGNVGLTLACKKDNLNVKVTVSPPTAKSPGTSILITCSP